MAEHALKEWAVTIEALLRGNQVMLLRKGGIGEKQFVLPHRRFFLFPGYLHQRPELIADPWRTVYADPLSRVTDPAEVSLRAWAQLDVAYPITGPDALVALGDEHILTPDYAAKRLRWRRKHPLWAVILRVWRVSDPPRLTVGPEHGGCVSWIPLPASIREPPSLDAALDDRQFAAARTRIESIIATGVAH